MICCVVVPSSGATQAKSPPAFAQEGLGRVCANAADGCRYSATSNTAMGAIMVQSLRRARSSIGVGAGDRPVERDRAEAAELLDLQTVEQPDRHRAAGVAPENVALAVAVEVAGVHDLPVAGHGTIAATLQ